MTPKVLAQKISRFPALCPGTITLERALRKRGTWVEIQCGTPRKRNIGKVGCRGITAEAPMDARIGTGQLSSFTITLSVHPWCSGSAKPPA